ncbi:TonB-dependent receptor domain-containing protein, partial [Paracoccus sp. (in: a-proteobacteria)]|uniref:TonB-dependent receptor n=1 Tax=Paracoccus sp. TaxID=267 RepID=UPI0028AE8E14
MKRISSLALRGALIALFCGTMTPGGAVAQTATTLRFDMPAQPLAQAVNRIGQIAGISVLVQGDSYGRTSPALAGSMSLDAALQRVLAESGARYRFTRQGSLVVELRSTAQGKGRAAGTVTLDTVVITATGSAQDPADAPATMTVIPGDDLRRRPFLSIAEALRDVPGLSVAAPGRDGGTPISIRGMGQSYVLFMIDGKPLSASEEAAYNGYGIETKAGFLPPASVVERIEIIRGPMSSLYGSAALGGVVHVITRTVPEIWSGRLDLGLTTANGGGSALQAGFALGGPLLADRLGLMLYGSRMGWRDRDGGGSVPPSSNRTNLGGRLSGSPAAGHVLDLDLWQSRLRFDAELRGQPATLRSEVRNRGASLTHRFDWGAGAETASFLLREITNFDIGNDSGHEALTFGTRSSLPIGSHKLTFGFEHRREQTRHDPDRLPDSATIRPERWHQAFFGEGQLTLSPDLTLTLGLRHDRDQRYASELTPRLYAVWHATSALTIRGGAGSGYRVPALKQADDHVWEPSGGDGRSRDRGNGALRPERSTNYELGLSWRSEEGLHIGATLFESRFRDHIMRRDLCRTPLAQPPACELNGAYYEAVTQYVNADSARLRGAEITLDLSLGSMDLAANYTFSDSLITSGRDTGKPFHNLPRHVLNFDLDWRATEAMTLWTRAQYRSTAQALGRSAEIPVHTVVDIGLDYMLNDRATARLSLSNLGNVQPGDGDLTQA